MFNGIAAASRMAGEECGLRTVIINMANHVETTGPGSKKCHPEKISETVDGMIEQWPEVKDRREELLGKMRFDVEDVIREFTYSSPEVFDNIGQINIKYQTTEVRISIHRSKNLLNLYNGMHKNTDNMRIDVVSDNVVIFAESDFFNKKSSIKMFICFDCRIEPRYGETIPAGFRIHTPFRLDSNKCLSPIINGDGEIIIDGSVIIEAPVPIIANAGKCLIIRGKGKLHLKSTAAMQPCIGTTTCTGMSYGRWSPNGAPVDKIIIDGVEVTCESKEDSFTLGTYGMNIVPEIELRNGGKLTCPETTGKRIVVKQAKAPVGSTKISECMEYSIVKDGQSDRDLIRPEVKELINRLPESMRKAVLPTTDMERIQEAIRLTGLNPNLDVSLILNGEKRLRHAKTVTLLGCLDAYSDTEFNLEQSKVNYLKKTYFDTVGLKRDKMNDEETIEYVTALIIAVHDTLGVSITPYDYEVLYEMIPAYCFDHWVKGDNAGSVKRYMADNIEARKFLGKIRKDIYIEKCIEDLCT